MFTSHTVNYSYFISKIKYFIDKSMNIFRYDPTTGYFTAPVSGIYQFSLYLQTSSLKWSHLEIRKSSDILCAAIADGTSTGGDSPSGTCFTNVHLDVGDQVHVYKISGEDTALRVSLLLNGFTGHLITVT